MSLDVYLVGPASTTPCECTECGNVHERVERATLYERNITHNLARMAQAAGLYDALWQPNENGYHHAHELAPVLTAGLALLKAEPARFRDLNPANGWGDYPGLVDFVTDYLAACIEYPDAEVSASR